MTTCDSSLVCDFDENLLLAQLNELVTDDVNTTDATTFFKNVQQLLISFYDRNAGSEYVFELDFARALSAATDVGHLKVLKWLKKHEIDVIVKNVDDYTILHQAAEKGMLDIVEWLLAANDIDVNVKDCNDVTPLMLAVEAGRYELMRWLVEHGANVNSQTNKGKTCLWFAVCRGRVEALDWLVQRGANIYAERSDDATPLHMAATNGYLDAVQWLTHNGIDVNSKCGNGETALHLAANEGHSAVVHWLVENNADIDCANANGKTPLAIAAERGHVKLVEWLANCGANVNSVDRYGSTTFFTAVRRGQLAVTQWFVERGIVDINDTETRNMTSLHIAAFHGYSEMVKWLTANGASVHAVSKRLETPLCFAAQKGHLDVIQWLVKQGADVNCTDIDGNTPLLLIARYYHFSDSATFDWLIGNGADVCAVAVRRDALCWAVSFKFGNRMRRERMIARLILAGASLESHHETGRPKLSPLQCAVDASFIRLLLVADAEPTKEDLKLEYNKYVKDKCELLTPMLLKMPSLIEEIEDTELRELCSQTKVIEKVEQQMKETEQEWQRLVWQFCHERVTELAMVFVDLPAWIVAEIGFAEQKYLKQVPLYWVIDRIKKVKGVKKQK